MMKENGGTKVNFLPKILLNIPRFTVENGFKTHFDGFKSMEHG